MAHPNIFERRAHVARLVEGGVSFTIGVRRNLAALYDCDLSAIRNDVMLAQRPEIPYQKRYRNPPIHISARMRKDVLFRDGYTCQYCGGKGGEIIAEHVVPVQVGGYSMPCNLVAACQSCNVRKGSATWAPRNLDEITRKDPKWKEKILELAAIDSEINI